MCIRDRLKSVLQIVVRLVALANRKAAVFGQVAIRGWALFEGVLIQLIAWRLIELIKGAVAHVTPVRFFHRSNFLRVIGMGKRHILSASTRKQRQGRATAGSGGLALRLFLVFLALTIGPIYGHFFKAEDIAAAALILAALSDRKQD